MFGILAALCFAIAWIFNGAGFNHSTWLSAVSLALLGLFFLALHIVGFSAIAPAVPVRRRAPGE